MTTPQDPFVSPEPTPYGQPPYGQTPYGQAPFNQAPFNETPYGQAPVSAGWTGPPLASWGQRVGGYAIDSVIIVVIATALSSLNSNLGDLANLALLVVFGVLTGIQGQTPGRKIMKISVVKEADGTYLGAGAGVGRAFLHILDALPLLLGYFWPLWDAKRQTFADKIIKSVVIRVN